MGRNAEARTPVLDSLQDGIESGHRSFSNAITAYFQRLPWSPKVVLVVGVILMMLAMMMLKDVNRFSQSCRRRARLAILDDERRLGHRNRPRRRNLFHDLVVASPAREA